VRYLFFPGGAFPAGFVFGAADAGGTEDSDVSAVGAGAGAGAGAGGGSFSAAGTLAVGVGVVVTTGAGVDGGATGAAVVGTGLLSDGVDRSPSLIRAVTDPKPTRKAATHASGNRTFRLRIR
jgi:hypothetical protein